MFDRAPRQTQRPSRREVQIVLLEQVARLAVRAQDLVGEAVIGWRATDQRPGVDVGDPWTLLCFGPVDVVERVLVADLRSRTRGYRPDPHDQTIVVGTLHEIHRRPDAAAILL